MPRPLFRALALAALVVAALTALLEGVGGAAWPRRGSGRTTRVPDQASLPLTVSGLALLALAHRRRLAVRRLATRATPLSAAVAAEPS